MARTRFLRPLCRDLSCCKSRRSVGWSHWATCSVMHGEGAWLLLALIAGHVAMVGLHEAWRDGTLARMAGGRGATPSFFVDRGARRCHHSDMMNLPFGLPRFMTALPLTGPSWALSFRFMAIYGRGGEWRDWHVLSADAAVFFWCSAMPPNIRALSHRKRSRLRAAQGQYAVIGMDGRILARARSYGGRACVCRKARPVD